MILLCSRALCMFYFANFNFCTILGALSMHTSFVYRFKHALWCFFSYIAKVNGKNSRASCIHLNFKLDWMISVEKPENRAADVLRNPISVHFCSTTTSAIIRSFSSLLLTGIEQDKRVRRRAAWWWWWDLLIIIRHRIGKTAGEAELSLLRLRIWTLVIHFSLLHNVGFSLMQ